MKGGIPLLLADKCLHDVLQISGKIIYFYALKWAKMIYDLFKEKKS
jgi:hypothetical protein